MNETIAPGKYYLGDPTNVLPTKILIGIWENIYKCKNGKFEIKYKIFIGKLLFLKILFSSCHTHDKRVLLFIFMGCSSDIFIINWITFR